MTSKFKHGGPYDRGSADAYYGRPFSPHYWPLGTGKGVPIKIEEGTEDYKFYLLGWNEQIESDEFKDWGD